MKIIEKFFDERSKHTVFCALPLGHVFTTAKHGICMKVSDFQGFDLYSNRLTIVIYPNEDVTPLYAELTIERK